MPRYTLWSVLISLAHEVGQAKKYGTREEILKAEEALKYYEELCLESDEMILDINASRVT